MSNKYSLILGKNSIYNWKKAIPNRFWFDITFPWLILEIPHLLEHILNENPVPARRIVDEHVRDRFDELAVPDDRRAAQKCGQ